MTQTYQIALFEGDGIGPEITWLTVELLTHLSNTASCYDLAFTTLPAGAGNCARTGESLPQASHQQAAQVDAILLSAMGLPDVRYPDGTEISPASPLAPGKSTAPIAARRATP